MKTGYFHLSDEDRPALICHFLGLSDSDRRLRFGATLSEDAVSRFFTKLPIKFVYGFFLQDALIAVVVLAPDSPQHVEFAVSVAAEHRGRGLAQHLLEFAIADTPEDHLVIRHAAGNTAMRYVHKGYRSTIRIQGSEVDVDIDLKQLRADRQLAQNILCAAED